MQPTPHLDRWIGDVTSYRSLALDTNAVIYLLEDVPGYNELVRQVFLRMEQGLVTGVVSTMVIAEVLVKPLRERNLRMVERVEQFFRGTNRLVVKDCDYLIAERAALVRAGMRLAMPDAIIVATALEERCEALVGNDGTVARRLRGIPYLLLDNYVSR